MIGRIRRMQGVFRGRYISKSNPWIVMVSTSNAREGLFERIEKEPESAEKEPESVEKEPESIYLYKHLYLEYTYGLGRIYSEADIDSAKASPSFEREYNLKYLGFIGNVFHTKDIDVGMEKGRRFSADGTKNIYYAQKSIGLDPGFGSQTLVSV